MGWEDRKGKGQYYTRSLRDGNRVIRRYVRSGKRGKAALRAAEEDQERRRRDREKRRRERIELARLREIGDRIEDYYRRVNAIMESTLASAGYQRHSRGEWRKTGQPGNMRKDRTTMAEEMPAQAPATKVAPAGNGAPQKEMPRQSLADREIIRRADQGDETAREDFRAIVERHGPRGMRPLTEIARDDLLKKMGGKSIALEEDVRFQMENLRAQLIEPGSSPLEQLLADRIALCWLHLHYFELLWAQTLGQVTQKQSASYEQCLESAHRRYLSAIRSLAQIRRLRLPALQLNLANQQINLADRQVNLGAPTPSPSPAAAGEG